MSTAQRTPPLSQRLSRAATFLGHIRKGQSSDTALARLSPEWHASTRAIGFAALRQLGRAQFLLGHLISRQPDPAVENLLLVSLALMCQRPDEHSDEVQHPEHTLVNQTVQAARSDKRMTHAAGFINACLRRFTLERQNLMKLAMDDPVARWNHPLWWIHRLQHDHPAHWQQLLGNDLRKAPMVLRVRPEASKPPPQSRHVGAQAWALDQALPVSQIEGFHTGTVSVQDAAAQLAAPLLLQALNARIGPSRQQVWRVLDACAAPGGKTTHLLELSATLGCNVEVTALEIDPGRSQRIQENLDRCGLQARVQVADASRTADWWDGQAFDAILLDAPCSASGIVRRHPDVLWLRRESDLDSLTQIQSRLLDRLWPLLKPGGVMLYCTCSHFRAEGSEQVAAFLSRNTQATIQPAPGHLLAGVDPAETVLPDNRPEVSLPDSESRPPYWNVKEHDGFYYALLQHA